jgi:hypothetical protein
MRFSSRGCKASKNFAKALGGDEPQFDVADEALEEAP